MMESSRNGSLKRQNNNSLLNKHLAIHKESKEGMNKKLGRNSQENYSFFLLRLSK